MLTVWVPGVHWLLTVEGARGALVAHSGGCHAFAPMCTLTYAHIHLGLPTHKRIHLPPITHTHILMQTLFCKYKLHQHRWGIKISGDSVTPLYMCMRSVPSPLPHPRAPSAATLLHPPLLTHTYTHTLLPHPHGALQIWSPHDAACVFLACICNYFERRPQEVGSLVFDKVRAQGHWRGSLCYHHLASGSSKAHACS